MIFFWAFVVGGLICVIGQIMFDVFKLTPAHTLTIFVIAGAVLDGLGLYEPLIDNKNRQSVGRCQFKDVKHDLSNDTDQPSYNERPKENHELSLPISIDTA